MQRTYITVFTPEMWPMLIPPLASYCPLFLLITPFYLLGEPAFLACGANSHPLLSLVCYQLLTFCYFTHPDTPHTSGYNIYIDDINNISRPVWYTSVKLSGCKGGYMCETWIVGTNTRYWVGQNKQERNMWKGTGKRFSLTKNEAMTNVFEKCFKKIAAQVCTKYMITWLCQENCRELSAVYCPCLIILPIIIRAHTSGFPILIDVFFSAG